MFVKDFPTQDSTTQNVIWTTDNNLVVFSPSQILAVTTFLLLDLPKMGDLGSILTQIIPWNCFSLFFFS